MKFSSTLQFNAVSEWRGHYIDYDQLKALIFRLERAELPAFRGDSDDLVGNAGEVFCDAIRDQLRDIDSFYKQIEFDAIKDLERLSTQLQSYFTCPQYRDDHSIYLSAIPSRFTSPDRPLQSYQPASTEASILSPHNAPQSSTVNLVLSEDTNDGAAASDSSDEEAEPTQRRKSSDHHEIPQSEFLPFESVSLQREITRCYVLLNDLLSFSSLNREGVRKALKKFDKVHGTTILPEFMSRIPEYHVFSDNANEKIGEWIHFLISSFSKLSSDPQDVAAEKLSSLLREHVVYQRNTVWRELIGLERQAQGFQQGTDQPLQARKKKLKVSFTLLGTKVSLGAQFFVLLTIVLTSLLILIIEPLESAVQSRCLALVVFSSSLWATESLPLYVTSLLVPVLVVVMKIPINEQGKPMSPKEASAFVFAKMWSPVIMVLLGGFTLAAALSKHNIAKALAQSIISRVGTNNPHRVLLSLMFVAAFLCMWISNVAAPVLLFSVAQPLLRMLPPGDPFNKALIIGIALASNVGGMASPIASPQNIIALNNMVPVPSWMEWFAASIPVSVISIVLIWAWLCITFPITKEAREALAHTRSTGSGDVSQFGKVQYFVLLITSVTIILWCFSHQLEPYFGDMGILALIPIVLLFGLDILNAADFNNFLWTIVALAMGGIVLGQSVESCGLLATVTGAIQEKVSHLPLFAICLTFGFAILVVASFISHTVAALIILPLVKSIGKQLDDPHPRLLVIISAFLCSGAMALPTSGFPNVTAICLVNEFGTPYLSAIDLISRGVPASFICYFIVVTLGYVICRILGF